MNPAGSVYRRAIAGFKWLIAYHDYEVHGFENIPQRGPALIVANHSLATYDSLLLGVHMMDHLRRRPRVLADRTIFRTPVLGAVCTELGFVNGTRENAMRLLKEGEIVGTAPGGMREGLRSSREKYRIDWHDRLGFVRMSMLTGAPIVLAACPTSDDIFDVLPNPFTPWIYDRFHLPLPLFRGRGGLPIPKPVKLWHVLSEPIVPDELGPDGLQEGEVERHHRYLVERMERLMAEALTRKASR